MPPLPAIAALALLPSRSSPPAAATTTPAARDGRIAVVATTTQAADLTRAVAGERAEVDAAPRAQRRPARLRAAPGATSKALADADARRALRRRPRRLARRRDRERRQRRGRRSTLIDACARPARRRGRPALVAGPAQRGAGGRGDRGRAGPRDPDGAAAYDANAARYTRRLTALDGAIARCLDRIPAAQRKLVTTHDALGYYADRYGLEVIGAVIPSRSTQAQASAGEIAELVEHDPARGRQGDLRRELGQPQARAGGRRRGRRDGRTAAVGRHARPGGLGGRDLPRLAGRQHAARSPPGSAAAPSGATWRPEQRQAFRGTRRAGQVRGHAS